MPFFSVCTAPGDIFAANFELNYHDQVTKDDQDFTFYEFIANSDGFLTLDMDPPTLLSYVHLDCMQYALQQIDVTLNITMILLDDSSQELVCTI